MPTPQKNPSVTPSAVNPKNENAHHYWNHQLHRIKVEVERLHLAIDQ